MRRRRRCSPRPARRFMCCPATRTIEPIYAPRFHRSAISRRIPNIDYAIEDYPVRLIALDTLSPGNGRGDFRPEQARRLIEMMDADLNKPIAVFTHHPPFEVTVGPDRCHFETIDGIARLRDALQDGERVTAVFSGHVHRAAAGLIGRIPARVVPCIATTLRKGEYPPSMKTRPVYHLHRFDPAYGFATESRIVRTDSPAAMERRIISTQPHIDP